jgi:hypothetical protein
MNSEQKRLTAVSPSPGYHVLRSQDQNYLFNACVSTGEMVSISSESERFFWHVSRPIGYSDGRRRPA